MKKYLIMLAVVALSFAVTDPASAHGGHGKLKWDSYRWRTCQLPYQTDKEVQKLIRCAVDHFPTSLTTALYVAKRESGFEHWVYNGICCGGVYQHHLSYWSSRVKAYNAAVGKKMRVKDEWRNGRSNVLVAIRMAHRGGWGPWTTA